MRWQASSVKVRGGSGWRRNGSGGGRRSFVRTQGRSGWSKNGTGGSRQSSGKTKGKEWVEKEWNRRGEFCMR
jgi:hypothetical protein